MSCRAALAALGLVLGLASCTAAEKPPGSESMSTRTATSASPSVSLIGTCPLSDLEVNRIGSDGAGGHSIHLIGFLNAGGDACDLVDPEAIEAVAASRVQVHRGSFFPVVRSDHSLEVGQTAVVSVETSRCDQAEQGLRLPVTAVIIHFPGGVSVEVPLEEDGVCGVSWEGFRVWE